MRCGLLGRKLGHSYSPEIHNQLADYSYELFEKEPEELEFFLRNGDYIGLNVTIPYKKTVMQFCDKLSPIAERLGAVNTIVRQSDGSLIGHNSDFFGFHSLLNHSGLHATSKKVLVLGSGGASATVVAALNELGAQTVVISRTGENNYTNLNRHFDASIIVNTTPVGMYPNTQESPIELAQFSKLEGVLDVIYNPAHTALLQQAEQMGIVAKNGLWMLVAQAKESSEWFTGNQINDRVIPAIHKKLQEKMTNIVLVGMPGCGKSSVGALLAQKTGKKFIDADKEIEGFAGRTIPEIFAATGEEGFRDIETKVLSELGKRSGCVIATGGGCVTRRKNYPLLHCNGTIIQLQRDIRKLPTAGRPLSQAGELDQMYRVRKPLYDAFSDCIVDNNTDIDKTVQTIISIINREA